MGSEGEYYVESDDKCECGCTKFIVKATRSFYVEATTGRLWGDDGGDDSSKVICSECKKELYGSG